ncbi:MAG: diguanylate cyclase, partial [Enterobacterales bacterium]|nr:diguanylate cyclase [Enterobacterales bacterium]
MPFEDIQDGKHLGLAADLIQIISQNIQVPFLLQATNSWQETMDKALQRQCDIVSFLLKTPDRTKFLNFTQAYFNEPFAIATTKDKPYVRDVKDILEQKVALVKGYAYVEILQHKYPQLNIIQVDSIDQGLLMLSDREIDAYLDGLNVIGYKIQQHGYQHIKVSGKFSETWNMRIGSRNDMPLINSILNKGIQSISLDDRKKIRNKWLTVTYDYRFDYKAIVVMLLLISGGFLLMLIRQKSLKERNKELERLSETDKLTKLSNRRKLDQYLQHYIDRFERYNESFSIIMLDIDRFKLFNDQFGHLVGDKVLIAVASILEENCRKIDILGRWGGEEFLIICPNTKIESVEKLANLLREMIAENQFEG